MFLPVFSVKQPVTTLMVMCVVVLLGVVSLTQLPMDLLPRLEQPVLVISTPFPGSGPEEVAAMVTIPIERVLSVLAGVQRVSSQSSEGWSQVVLEFAWGTDMREARDMVKDRLARLRFVEGVGTPTISRYDPSAQAIMTLSITGPDDPVELRAQAEERVLPLVEAVDGVGSVSLSGGRSREISVSADQTKLRQYGLTLSQVNSIIAASNLTQPADAVRDEEGRLLNVRVMGRLTSLEDLANLVLTYAPLTLSPGQEAGRVALQPVRLQDVAEVTEGLAPVTTIVRTGGRPSVTLSVFKEGDANTVQVARRVERALVGVDGDLEVFFITSQARFIEEALNAVRTNLMTGGFLALTVLVIALRSLGNTAIIGVSIPFSVIATFALLYFTKLTMNVMTLGGLALGVGMLVDNSIVVIENIHRFRQLGHDPTTAAIGGSQEVAGAITASTLTTVAVFLPVTYVAGMTGQLFKELALTVTCSLLASLVVALTVVPMLASQWTRTGESGVKTGTPGRAARAYRSLLGRVLGRPALTLAIAVLFAASSFSLLPGMGREFLPSVDEATINLTLTMPDGTQVQETSGYLASIEALFSSIPEVRVYTSSSSGARGRIVARLQPREVRHRSLDDIMADLAPRAGALAGPGTVTLSSQGTVFGQAAGSSRTLQLTLSGPSQAALESILDQVLAAVGSVRGVENVTSSLDRRRPELHVVVDQEEALRYGLTAAQVSSTVRSALAGSTPTQLELANGRNIPVRVRLRPEDRETVAALSRLQLRGTAGPVELGRVATITTGGGPRSLSRVNSRSTVTISATVEGRDLGSASREARAAVAALELPDTFRVGTEGAARMMDEGFQGLGLALGLAVALVYMIMAAQFESLLHPLVIMGSVPLAATGALVALFVTGRPLGVTGMIGLIMLAGIVVNNAIVLVDYTNQLRRRGMVPRDALLEAATTRLRPIIMTAATTILALLPLAWGRGQAGELQQPLALAVTGGLTTSTLLTLLVVPSLYLVVSRWSQGRYAETNRGIALP
ncbi:MAG: efflux RND transporter permease subunit [Bacillota bacterium]